MPRPKGSTNKFNIEKEAAKLQEQAEELSKSLNSPETNSALLMAGIGISLNTLIRAAAGDKSIEGISATNMVTAAKELLAIGIKVYGEETFKKLQEKAQEEQEQIGSQGDTLVTNQEESFKEPKVVGFIKRFEG